MFQVLVEDRFTEVVRIITINRLKVYLLNEGLPVSRFGW